MKFSKSLLAASVALATGVVQAGTVNVSKDINITGDIAAGGFYTVNHGGAGVDSIEITDFGIGFDTGETKAGEVGFIGVIGYRAGHTILDQNSMPSYTLGESMALDFGYATYKPNEMITLDVGFLLTTIGAESSVSALSSNISRGFLWNSEPAAYEGARASFDLSGTTVSLEANHDTSQGTAPDTVNWQISASSSASGVDFGATYYDGKDSRNLLDILVSTKIAGMDFTFNLDYFMVDDAPAGVDDTAMGIGLYLTPSFGKIDIPIRFEHVTDGTSGIYGGVDTAMSLTITPTYNTSDSSYVRAEISFVSSDNKIFADEDGVATDTQTQAAFQIGYVF